MKKTSTEPLLRSYTTASIIFILFLCLLAGSFQPLFAQTNLITNGDFSAGNTGFTSEYVYTTNLYPEGNYYVGNNPRDYHYAFCDMNTEALRSPGLPEGSRGNMLIGNASGDASLKLWAQSITVTPHTNYTFSFYAVSLADPINSLFFGLHVNCKRMGQDITATSTCGWTKYTIQFNSGSLSSIELSLRNMSLQRGGNDIAIDDIQFYEENPSTSFPLVIPFVWKGYNTNWFDPDNWGSCTIPTCADNITIPAGLAYYPVITTNASTAAAGKITIQAGGSLTLNPNVTLNVCGDFINNGNFTADNSATISFNGTTNQEVNISGQFTNLRVNQSLGRVLTAKSNIIVTGVLTLTTGLLQTNGFEVSVTNTAATAITGQNPHSYVIGNLRRAVNGTQNYDFPIGDALRYELIKMYVTADLGVNSVLGFFTTSNAAGTSGLPITEGSFTYNSLGTGGYWHLSPDIAPAGSARYDLEAFPVNIHCSDINTSLVKRTDSSTNWSLAGSTAESGNPNRRNGYSTFSEISLASGAPIALPVQLLSFHAVQAMDAVNLQWSTANEHNSDYFAIERSLDAKTFTEVGRLQAIGESKSLISYQFTDTTALTGIIYYQLRQVDKDGKPSLSKVVAVQVRTMSPSPLFTLYPNPAEGQLVYLKTNYFGEVNISIHNHFGKAISRQSWMANGEEIELNAGLNLPKGMYVVSVTTSTQTYQQKLVVK